MYYEDLYPLICFLPRYATHSSERATDDDMLPLWKSSAMDNEKHKTAHTLTSSRPLSPDHSVGRAGSAPPAGAPSGTDDNEKDLGQLSEDQIYHSLRGRLKRKKSFDPEMALPVVYSEHPLLPARNPPKESLYDYLPFLRVFKMMLKALFRPLLRPFRRHKPEPEPQIPTSASAATRSFTGKKLRPEAIE